MEGPTIKNVIAEIYECPRCFLDHGIDDIQRKDIVTEYVDDINEKFSKIHKRLVKLSNEIEKKG